MYTEIHTYFLHRQSNTENGDISNTELFAVPEADLELKERIFMKKFSAYSSYPGMFMGEFHSGFAAADGILARGRNTGARFYLFLFLICILNPSLSKCMYMNIYNYFCFRYQTRS